jgi:hypothetical protein
VIFTVCTLWALSVAGLAALSVRHVRHSVVDLFVCIMLGGVAAALVFGTLTVAGWFA